jgi:hypothetical protein
MRRSVDEIVKRLEEVAPDFTSSRIGLPGARRLCAAAGVDLSIGPIAPMGMVTPKIGGVHTIYVSDAVPFQARPFVILHELAHVLAGEAEELTVEVLDERRYPLKDQVADQVAAIGITSGRDRQLPMLELAALLRELVPVDSRAWQRYRSLDVACALRGGDGWP